MIVLKRRGKEYTIKDIITIIIKYKIPDLLRKISIFGMKMLPLKNRILFESMTEFDGNGREVFKQFYSSDKYSNWRFVWLIKSPDAEIPGELLSKKNIIFVRCKTYSFKTDYYVSTSRILFFENMIFDSRRKKQIRVYLTHGFPIKNTINTIVVPKSTDYVCCQSRKYAYIQEKQFAYSHDKSIFLGSPRNDAFFFGTDELIKLGIRRSDYKKIIIWMPTFRKLYTGRIDGQVTPSGLPVVETEEELGELDRICRENSALLIVKLHPHQDKTQVRIKSTDNVRIFPHSCLKKQKVILYSLLVQTDGMISDYSSVSLDYILLDKPIGYMTGDAKGYSRGFSDENFERFMPGEKIHGFKDLEKFVADVCRDKDRYRTERNKLREEFWDYSDGKSAERIYKFISEKAEEKGK